MGSVPDTPHKTPERKSENWCRHHIQTVLERLAGGFHQMDPHLAAELADDLVKYFQDRRLCDMPRKTYSIDLKMGFTDESRFSLVEKLMRRAAQQVLTQATMIADDGKQPQVALRSEDFFVGTDELKILEKGQENGAEL